MGFLLTKVLLRRSPEVLTRLEGISGRRRGKRGYDRRFHLVLSRDQGRRGKVSGPFSSSKEAVPRPDSNRDKRFRKPLCFVVYQKVMHS
jgi:hypothetical protein